MTRAKSDEEGTPGVESSTVIVIGSSVKNPGVGSSVKIGEKVCTVV